MKNIKKSDILLIAGLLVVVILSCFLMKGEKLGPGGSYELSYSEYVEKTLNGDKFVLVVESSTCSHCINYMPVVKRFSKSKGVKIYYIDTNTLKSDEWSTFEESNSFFVEKKEEGWGTPTTLFLDGNVAVDHIVGEATIETLESYYNRYIEYFEKIETDE